MAGPICRCPRGHVFESQSIRIENSIGITIGGGTEPCRHPGCFARARVINATYDVMPDNVRVAIGPNASLSERAAIQGFVSAMTKRRTAPSPEAIDKEFHDVNPQIRAWIKTLILTLDWPKVQRLLVLILPYIVALQLSAGTDARVADVSEQINELNRKVEAFELEMNTELQRLLTTTTTAPNSRPAPTLVPAASGRANPKGTPPSRPKRRNAKRRGR